MPDPINLRLARKAKARAHKEQTAAQNRVSFGQSKAGAKLLDARSNQAAKRLDGAKLQRVKIDEPD